MASVKEVVPTICAVVPRQRVPATNFGKRLVQLRRARGLTQTQLAEATGTTQRVISYHENHASYPHAPFLLALARALEISTDELLGFKTNGARNADTRRLGTDAQTQKLWKKFRMVGELPDRDQRAVFRLINSLATARQTNGR